MKQEASVGMLAGRKRSALAVIAAMALGLFSAVAVNAAPVDPSRVAAVFPPWWTPSQSLAAAGGAGDIAATGIAPFIVILRGDPIDLARRARSAGALFILDPDMAGICSPKDSSQ